MWALYVKIEEFITGMGWQERGSIKVQKNGHSYEQLQISLKHLFNWLQQTVSNYFYMPVIIFLQPNY